MRYTSGEVAVAVVGLVSALLGLATGILVIAALARFVIWGL